MENGVTWCKSHLKFKKKIKNSIKNLSVDDIDRFAKKEMKKMRLIKNNWYDWLINYIP